MSVPEAVVSIYRRHVVLLLAGGLIATGVLVAAGQESGSLDSQRRLALRNGGLRAAAAVTGSFRGSVFFDDLGAPGSLPALVRAADAIVVGTVQTNASHLTRDGLSILMAYGVSPDTILNGRIAADEEFSVIVPGGRIGFEDGSWAELHIPDFRRPSDGRRYLLLLKDGARYRDQPSLHGKKLWVPAFGPLGIFDLSEPRGRLLPSGGWRLPLARDLAKARWTPDGFVTEVQRILNER